MLDPPTTSNWRRFSALPPQEINEGKMVAVKTVIQDNQWGAPCAVIEGIPVFADDSATWHTPDVRMSRYFDTSRPETQYPSPVPPCRAATGAWDMYRWIMNVADCEGQGFSRAWCQAAPKGTKRIYAGSNSVSSTVEVILENERSAAEQELERKTRCSSATALSDPTCFGTSSTICNPTDPTKRYEWCTATIQKLCADDGYRSNACACIAPFEAFQTRALAEFGVPADRFCVSTDNSDTLHEKCKAGAYQITPTRSCPNSCINVNLGTDGGWARQENITVVCDPKGMGPRIISVPGTDQSMEVWSRWWSAKNWQPFASGTASIDLMNIVRQFLRAVANSQSAADLYAIRPVVANEIAGEELRVALEGIDARISAMSMPRSDASVAEWVTWLEKDVTKFSDTTTPTITNVATAAARMVQFATAAQIEQLRGIFLRVESLPARTTIARAIAGLPPEPTPAQTDQTETTRQEQLFTNDERTKLVGGGLVFTTILALLLLAFVS